MSDLDLFRVMYQRALACALADDLDPEAAAVEAAAAARKALVLLGESQGCADRIAAEFAAGAAQ